MPRTTLVRKGWECRRSTSPNESVSSRSYVELAVLVKIFARYGAHGDVQHMFSVGLFYTALYGPLHETFFPSTDTMAALLTACRPNAMQDAMYHELPPTILNPDRVYVVSTDTAGRSCSSQCAVSGGSSTSPGRPCLLHDYFTNPSSMGS